MSDAKWTEFNRIQRYCLAERRLMAPNKRREIINILGMYLHKELPSACCAFLLWYPFPMTGALGNHGPVNDQRDQIQNKQNNRLLARVVTAQYTPRPPSGRGRRSCRTQTTTGTVSRRPPRSVSRTSPRVSSPSSDRPSPDLPIPSSLAGSGPPWGRRC